MTEEPIEDRVKMFKTDGPAQRHRIWQLRAELGLHEHPEWTDDKIAEEYVGASPEYVAEARERRTHGGTYVEQPAPADEAKERAEAYRRLADSPAPNEPKPGLLDRITGIWRGR